MIQETELCKAEIKKNIVLVETGQPLTLPLSLLNRSCEFREAWNKAFDVFHPEYKILDKDKMKAYYEANKDKMKAYREANKDKINKRGKAYYEANKDKMKAYREANKDKIKDYKKAYYEANKDKINKKRRERYLRTGR